VRDHAAPSPRLPLAIKFIFMTMSQKAKHFESRRFLDRRSKPIAEIAQGSAHGLAAVEVPVADRDSDRKWASLQ